VIQDVEEEELLHSEAVVLYEAKELYISHFDFGSKTSRIISITKKIVRLIIKPPY